MRVLIITDKLDFGGAEMYFCKLENHLQDSNITFHFAAGNGQLYGRIKNKQRFHELSRTNHIQNIKKLVKIVLEKKIDLIHANSLRMVLYCICVRKISTIKFKIVYTKHNVTILENKSRRAFAYLINKCVERVITVSDFEKNSLIEAEVKENKITTVYNGVDLNQFGFSQKKKGEFFKVGLLARLSEEKNHELFIRIADKLRDIPHFEFYIAGDGPRKQKIKSMIETCNLSHKIKLVGAVNRPEEFIKNIDILLLTSYREVFPMVILEAMAVGASVIAIDRGGIKEAIIDKETGFLIRRHSADEFCRMILKIESDESLKYKLIENARRKVEEEFSLDKMVENTLREYRMCLK
ncbi:MULTISPECIES: glycosyltransferase family 4 protein [Cytobacillus]|uniref:glycosyltransferase family 4 protein n=1 Tax=Cytobacillus TaxID=2675230 RepID=UPI00203CADCE|nr:glycosyltransferase family 4 protein [Cytobacillus firmus]MCM3707859.1 glycosyltransferase family 4 protein [Cytobacillus firmus]